ncbi:glutamate--cysteine ligase [Sugiyamaella lignohabitans]|uniref:Glutamate--cysteine ligase n=1 Tax=Sugiyamaella lignohabitans TaxID=796027 RepID=A0A167EV99_9ASCO|nr:glutamate--cysteine ligase [Sugiyamaella lignohabitans]ANB14503.1 glutamate--cysteine ligase [Sugiyamaella lignohabitans]
MGLLSLGTPLEWNEVSQYTDHVREHGIEQLIHIHNANKDKKNDSLLWGDEVEYMVVELDPESKEAKLSLRQAQILDDLAQAEKKGDLTAHNVVFHPEYGRYMLEATPAKPFTGDFKDLLLVEANMATRRTIAKEHMNSNEFPLTLTSYPRLGVGQFTSPAAEPNGKASRSFFLPDEIINPHVRFPTLTANIRTRRGSKVAINVPIYKDEKTPSPFVDDSIPWDRDLYPEDANAREGAALPDHIYMDSMGFGMGCSCLQITFQATDIDEGRDLYDQLAPLAPILLALTAAAPAYRGYLSDQDARWNVIAGSVDDRTPVERGLVPADDINEESEDSEVAQKAENNENSEKNEKTNGKAQFCSSQSNRTKTTSTTKYPSVKANSDRVIPKSRYDSIDSYISGHLKGSASHFNDTKLVINKKVKKRLTEAGFDEQLSNHFAHLFIRDPIVIFKELLDIDDTKESDHFENIQSTNWQTMRFKPPPPSEGPNQNVGWRVEFRPMEVQITDFENAAFSVFIVLVTRVILSYKLNFYIPISKVDENMKVAHYRDAVNKNKFWFRTDIESPTSQPDTETEPSPGIYELLSINEIINGKADKSFIGLVPLIRRYLNYINIDLDTLCQLDRYLSLISRRASGELWTAATWMRHFITSHPKYNKDSKISSDINYDLMQKVYDITQGKGWDDGLTKHFLGGFSSSVP